MGFKNLVFVFSIILVSVTTITGFNITRLLEKHPDFSTFNDFLSKTGVAQGINARRTITVLVVENSGMSSITSKSESTIRYILANHVILDYYDELKLGDLSKKKYGVLVTTLLQTTGIASRQQGFLNVTVARGGNEVVFGSGVKGAQHDARMQTVVASQPGNISVIQISQPIIAPGLEGGSLPPSDSPLSSEDSEDTSPPKKKGKGKDEDEDEDEDADAPSDDTADDDDNDSAKSPSGGKKDEKAADSDEEKKKNNGGGKVVGGGGAMVGVLMGLLGLGLLL